MADDPRVQELLDELLDGHATPEAVCASCPELLPIVRKQWRRMCRVRADLDALFPAPDAPSTNPDAHFPPPDEPTPRPPDDAALPRIPGYEVEAVLGRGGMGIVFRARHLRLKRLVALKMALAGDFADPRERERFQREAEAAAGLRHPNVVQIHDVGDADGRPYLTMELVEGGSLAQKLAGTPQPVREAASLLAVLAGAVQAAHACGVIHRDLKPGNVLLTPDGTPKVSDFGLARRLEGGAGLTQSGVPLGTPSYMAPEQARGQTQAIRPAVDVYALGAILYEMLTGRPPFRGETAAETVLQVIFQDPVPPSRLNPRVPRDLETICLKCLSKEPERRYASAAALADDLKRFEEGRPIQARPLSLGSQLWRWCRRKPMAAAFAMTMLALVGLASGGGVWFVQQQARHDEELHRDVSTAVTQAASLRKGFHFHEARELLEQARQRLEPAGPADLRRQVDQDRADLELAERLDAARMQLAVHVGGRFDPTAVEALYASAFAEAGLGREGKDVEAVAARLRDSEVYAELLAALDEWASITPDQGRQEWLLAVARRADPDPIRDRLRDPELWQDAAKLTELARKLGGTQLSPALATALGRAARRYHGQALPLLTGAQIHFPDDFWLNLEVGLDLYEAKRLDEAIGYLRAALALRPNVSEAYNTVGEVLQEMGRLDEGIAHLREAVRLDPKSVRAHSNLGTALFNTGRLNESIDPLQEALRLDPNFALAHNNLGIALRDKGQLDEAIAHFQEAIRIEPKTAMMHTNLGQTRALGQHWAQAVDSYARALECGPENEGFFWFEYAALLLLSGDRPGYEKACAHLVDRFGKDKGLRSYHVARACTLAPDAVADASLPGRLAEKELQGSREFWSLTEQGALAYRAGRYQEAVPLFEQSLKADAKPGRAVLNWLWLALANQRLGKAEEARRWLGKAQAWFDQYGDGMPARTEAEVGLHLHNWLEAHVLRREAEALIQPAEKSRES